MEFKIDVNVTLGMTPGVEVLLGRLLGESARLKPEALRPEAEGGDELREGGDELREGGDLPEETAAEAAVEATSEDTAAEAAVEATSEDTAAEAAVEPPTDDEMKTMMDVTISRFAGNGWQTSKEGEVVKMRRNCTKVFKEIARHLGAEKPTALQGEKRLKFLEELERICRRAGGTEIEWVPF